MKGERREFGTACVSQLIWSRSMERRVSSAPYGNDHPCGDGEWKHVVADAGAQARHAWPHLHFFEGGFRPLFRRSHVGLHSPLAVARGVERIESIAVRIEARLPGIATNAVRVCRRGDVRILLDRHS